jgi:hypothetical protein
VVKSRRHHCGDIELAGYLANTVGPVSLVLVLRIVHDRVGSSTDPTLNGHLRYPNNLDQSLNDAVADKIRKYRADYNNNPPSAVLVRLGGYIVNLSDFYSYRLIGKLTAFLKLQEFSLRNLPVVSSTSAARLSLNSSKAESVWLSLRRQLYALRLI